jgi:hypothetical protein
VADDKYSRDFGGKTYGQTPFPKPKPVQEDNIQMELKGRGWDSVNWVDLFQDRDKQEAVLEGGSMFGFLK